MTAEIIIISFLLSSLNIIKYSLYIALGISLILTVYVFVITPYSNRLNNIRLMIHRVLLTLLILGFILCKNYVPTDADL